MVTTHSLKSVAAGGARLAPSVGRVTPHSRVMSLSSMSGTELILKNKVGDTVAHLRIIYLTKTIPVVPLRLRTSAHKTFSLNSTKERGRHDDSGEHTDRYSSVLRGRLNCERGEHLHISRACEVSSGCSEPL